MVFDINLQSLTAFLRFDLLRKFSETNFREINLLREFVLDLDLVLYCF